MLDRRVAFARTYDVQHLKSRLPLLIVTNVEAYTIIPCRQLELYF